MIEENIVRVKSRIMINVNAKCKKHHLCEKNYISNLTTCSCKNGKYFASITNNSVIKCDKKGVEAKSYNEETKTIPKNIICKTKSFYILLAFSLITIVLLIVFSIYFCLIKYKAKQKMYCHIMSQMTN